MNYKITQVFCETGQEFVLDCVFTIDNDSIDMLLLDGSITQNWRQVVAGFFQSNGTCDPVYLLNVLDYIEVGISENSEGSVSGRYGFGSCTQPTGSL